MPKKIICEKINNSYAYCSSIYDFEGKLSTVIDKLTSTLHQLVTDGYFNVEIVIDSDYRGRGEGESYNIEFHGSRYETDKEQQSREKRETSIRDKQKAFRAKEKEKKEKDEHTEYLRLKAKFEKDAQA